MKSLKRDSTYVSRYYSQKGESVVGKKDATSCSSFFFSMQVGVAQYGAKIISN